MQTERLEDDDDDDDDDDDNNNNNNSMSKEQKGCRRRSNGCKDQLLISTAILQKCKRRKKNVCMVWLDCQQTIDGVPHSRIIKYLELIGINNKTVSIRKNITPLTYPVQNTNTAV